MSLLAERIDELLNEVLRRTEKAADIPETAPAALRDDGPLDLPLTEDFRVGAIALAWDSDGGPGGHRGAGGERRPGGAAVR